MGNNRRLIDADELLERMEQKYKDTVLLIQSGETHLDNLAEGYTEVDILIGVAPAVEAVEVVRCKDCKHRHNGKDCSHPLLLSYSWGAIRHVKDDDFCSYGEK